MNDFIAARPPEMDRINRLLCDEVRQWMLIVISEAEHHVCACDLAHLLGYDRSAVSKLLSPLKKMGIVLEARDRHAWRQLLSLSPEIRVRRQDAAVMISLKTSNHVRTTWRFLLTDDLVRQFDRHALLRHERTGASRCEERGIPHR